MLNKDKIKFEKTVIAKCVMDYNTERVVCLDWNAMDDLICINTDDEAYKTYVIDWLNAHPEASARWKTETKYANGWSEWTVELKNAKGLIFHSCTRRAGE